MPLANIKLTSPAFKNNGLIPKEYTCDGQGISPELTITDVSPDAKSLVLLVDDPDAPAGTWTHWLVFNLAANLTRIAEGKEPGGVKGLNSWGRTSYGAPCPPSGVHRYFFKVYALDLKLDLAEAVSRKQVEEKMQGHIVQQGELIGRYGR